MSFPRFLLPPLPSPNRLTSSPSLLTLLKACKSFQTLLQIHAQIIHKSSEQHPFLISHFIILCNNFSNISYATSVFNRVSQPNLCLWNSLLKGYSHHSSVVATLSFFNRLKLCETVSPDCFTFPPLIKVCSNELDVRYGRAVHGMVVTCGVVMDVFVGSSLINFYGKCKEVECARKVFDEISVRDNAVCWTAMIVGYLISGNLRDAQVLFDEMPCKNACSWNVMLNAFVKLGDLKSATKIFDEMPQRNVVAFTSLIDGYAKAGDMISARFLFEQAPQRDIVAWSALISGYVRNGQANEAVNIFFKMHSENVKPDDFVLVSVMSACSQVGNLQLAKWVDSYVVQNAVDLCHVHVGAALVDMNAKCGNMERATRLFEEMPKQDLVSYCSMMQGMSAHGNGAEAVQLFAKMVAQGVVPDDIAFTVVLTACSRAGLVEEGWRCFISMKDDYSIVPSSNHYACMIDLLGRAGHLEAAYELIKTMPVEPQAGALGGLLGACRLHSNIEVAEVVADRLFQIEPQNAGNYVLLSNVYAAANRWSDVALLRERMRERGLRKIPGCCWVWSLS